MKTKVNISGLPKGVQAYLEMNSVNQILKNKGLDISGDAQRFHTQNVLRRIIKYMPYRTGATIKLTIAQTNIAKPEIITDTPYAKMLYYGKVMKDPQTGAAGFLTSNGWYSRRGVPKVKSDRDIVYTKTKNPNAGPYWDRALTASEGRILAQELQNYIKRSRT